MTDSEVTAQSALKWARHCLFYARLRRLNPYHGWQGHAADDLKFAAFWRASYVYWRAMGNEGR